MTLNKQISHRLQPKTQELIHQFEWLDAFKENKAHRLIYMFVRP